MSEIVCIDDENRCALVWMKRRKLLRIDFFLAILIFIFSLCIFFGIFQIHFYWHFFPTIYAIALPHEESLTWSWQDINPKVYWSQCISRTFHRNIVINVRGNNEKLLSTRVPFHFEPCNYIISISMRCWRRQWMFNSMISIVCSFIFLITNYSHRISKCMWKMHEKKLLLLTWKICMRNENKGISPLNIVKTSVKLECSYQITVPQIHNNEYFQR